MLGFGATGQFAIGEVNTNEPVTLDKWFAPLSEPPRRLPGLLPSMMQFSAFDPQPFVPFSWFEPLSEPARTLPRLLPGEVQFAALADPFPFVSFSWFEALSEPVRTLPGLLPGQQQFEARPPQLRPTPQVTGKVAAVETKDVFLAGILEWSRITSAEVGVIESNFSGAQIGTAVAPITSAQVSIRII
jgi:hypothetical protein